jgi:hypothetical protein
MDKRVCCRTADAVLLLGNRDATVARMPTICCGQAILQTAAPPAELAVLAKCRETCKRQHGRSGSPASRRSC